ncbi:MAG TPA: metal-dependent hydrolase [Moraxellaceae bacterium]|nr:metal-dependent hydrolase [Moraxellaceae bacterium]
MKLLPFSRSRRPAATPRIRPQRMGFEFRPDAVPRYWFGGDPVLTHFLNALSLSFPDGEQFFVDSVRHFRDTVTDPARQKDISGFIGQEAMHSLEHKGFNEMLAAQGYGELTAKATGIARYLCNEGRKRFSPRAQLAITAGLEHITAILANAMLRQPELLEEMDPSVRMLWLWHAIEETEHKAVAFDLYKDIDPGYLMRVRAFLTGSLGLLMFSYAYTWRFLKQDGVNRQPLVLARGAVRLARFLGAVVPDYLDYLRPGFHPWDDDNRALIERYKREVEAAIAPKYRKEAAAAA